MSDYQKISFTASYDLAVIKTWRRRNTLWPAALPQRKIAWSVAGNAGLKGPQFQLFLAEIRLECWSGQFQTHAATRRDCKREYSRTERSPEALH
jgi:hypothetical protein